MNSLVLFRGLDGMNKLRIQKIATIIAIDKEGICRNSFHTRFGNMNCDSPQLLSICNTMVL